jgi:hypothetical protein
MEIKMTGTILVRISSIDQNSCRSVSKCAGKIARTVAWGVVLAVSKRRRSLAKNAQTQTRLTTQSPNMPTFVRSNGSFRVLVYFGGWNEVTKPFISTQECLLLVQVRRIVQAACSAGICAEKHAFCFKK